MTSPHQGEFLPLPKPHLPGTSASRCLPLAISTLQFLQRARPTVAPLILTPSLPGTMRAPLPTAGVYGGCEVLATQGGALSVHFKHTSRSGSQILQCSCTSLQPHYGILH